MFSPGTMEEVGQIVSENTHSNSQKQAKVGKSFAHERDSAQKPHVRLYNSILGGSG